MRQARFRRGAVSRALLDWGATGALVVLCAAVAFSFFRFRNDKPAPRPAAPQGSPIAGAPIDGGTAGTPPGPVVLPAEPPPTLAADGYIDVGWGILAGYPYAPPKLAKDGTCVAGRLDALPDDIKKMSHGKYAVVGYMLPMEMEDEKVRTFLLMRCVLTCCYGQPMNVNEWIEARVASGAVEYSTRQIRVAGELVVGEEFKDGDVVSVYRLFVDKVEEAE